MSEPAPSPAPPPKRPAVVLLGPTGSGKTPLGQVLQQRGLHGRRCVHFDFGAQLRRIVADDPSDSCLTRQEMHVLEHVLQSGALLEDQQFPIAQRILERFLAQQAPEADTVVVLNGLPRHVGQARRLAAMLEVQTVVHLVCSAEDVLVRIQRNTGGDRLGRQDDDPQSVREKLAAYQARTVPVLEYYRAGNVPIQTIEVRADMTAEQMWHRLHQGSLVP